LAVAGDHRHRFAAEQTGGLPLLELLPPLAPGSACCRACGPGMRAGHPGAGTTAWPGTRSCRAPSAAIG